MMDCKETLARLYEYLDDELTPEQAQMVAQHLELCRPCFDRAEFERSFGSFVKQAGQKTMSAGPLKAQIKARLAEMELAGDDEELFPDHGDTAPIDEVEPPETHISDAERVRTINLYRERGVKLPSAADAGMGGGGDRPRVIPFWSYLLAAAAVVLIAIPMIQKFGTESGPDPMVQALVAMHTDGRPELVESNATVLSDWIAQRAGFKPMVKEMADVGCDLKGAAVDSVWGTQLIHVFAEAEGKALSMLATSEMNFVMPGGMGVLQIEEDRYWTASEGGYSVVIWKRHSGGVICIAISQMPAAELARMARDAESRFEAGAA